MAEDSQGNSSGTALLPAQVGMDPVDSDQPDIPHEASDLCEMPYASSRVKGYRETPHEAQRVQPMRLRMDRRILGG